MPVFAAAALAVANNALHVKRTLAFESVSCWETSLVENAALMGEDIPFRRWILHDTINVSSFQIQ